MRAHEAGRETDGIRKTTHAARPPEVVPSLPAQLSPQAALHLQRAAGNQAVVQLVAGAGEVTVQRTHPADEALKRVAAKPSAESVEVVKDHKPNSKKTGITTWVKILKKVKTAEPEWTARRDHVMLGEDATPPTGLHSKQLLASAHSRAVGPKSPDNAPASKVYKQYTRNKQDNGTVASHQFDQHFKISTFFPNTWPEKKIQAFTLLRNAGEGHKVSAVAYTTNDKSIFPSPALANPPTDSLTT